MMTCKEIQRLLSEMVGVSSPMPPEVKKHLKNCKICRVFLLKMELIHEELEGSSQKYPRLPIEYPEEDFFAKQCRQILDSIQTEGKSCRDTEHKEDLYVAKKSRFTNRWIYKRYRPSVYFAAIHAGFWILLVLTLILFRELLTPSTREAGPFTHIPSIQEDSLKKDGQSLLSSKNSELDPNEWKDLQKLYSSLLTSLLPHAIVTPEQFYQEEIQRIHQDLRSMTSYLFELSQIPSLFWEYTEKSSL